MHVTHQGRQSSPVCRLLIDIDSDCDDQAPHGQQQDRWQQPTATTALNDAVGNDFPQAGQLIMDNDCADTLPAQHRQQEMWQQLTDPTTMISPVSNESPQTWVLVMDINSDSNCLVPAQQQHASWQQPTAASVRSGGPLCSESPQACPMTMDIDLDNNDHASVQHMQQQHSWRRVPADSRNSHNADSQAPSTQPSMLIDINSYPKQKHVSEQHQQQQRQRQQLHQSTQAAVTHSSVSYHHQMVEVHPSMCGEHMTDATPAAAQQEQRRTPPTLPHGGLHAGFACTETSDVHKQGPGPRVIQKPYSNRLGSPDGAQHDTCPLVFDVDEEDAEEQAGSAQHLDTAQAEEELSPQAEQTPQQLSSRAWTDAASMVSGTYQASAQVSAQWYADKTDAGSMNQMADQQGSWSGQQGIWGQQQGAWPQQNAQTHDAQDSCPLVFDIDSEEEEAGQHAPDAWTFPDSSSMGYAQYHPSAKSQHVAGVGGQLGLSPSDTFISPADSAPHSHKALDPRSLGPVQPQADHDTASALPSRDTTLLAAEQQCPIVFDQWALLAASTGGNQHAPHAAEHLQNLSGIALMSGKLGSYTVFPVIIRRKVF